MDHSSFDDFEQQLAQPQLGSAPPALRRAVLDDVNRELRAARWDGRLARVAVVLLVVGVGLNASLVWQGGGTTEQRRLQLAHQPVADSLIETAIAVAEATSTETAQSFARQLAAFRGRALTDQEIAIIAAANRDRG